MEQILNGGQIAYGDMGWELEDSEKDLENLSSKGGNGGCAPNVWYEFEHTRPTLDCMDIIKCIKGVCEGREVPKYYSMPDELIELCRNYTKSVGVEKAVKMINEQMEF